ncbi:hypothetical protein N0V86_008082 [Didymella sp. IMI 355093]|nr:hypothetical protein N0V86_008082 [Didymella sp. IMI 355093]
MAKRTASNAFQESQRFRSLSPLSKKSKYRLSSPPYSPNRPVQSAPARLESRISHLDSDPDSSGHEVVDEDENLLLYRILTGLEYTRAQHAQSKLVMQTTRFSINKRENLHPGSALSVLRQAGLDGFATRVVLSDEHETWEIGVPRPDWVTEGAFEGLHDPQWWYGIDAAQVKAGPFPDEADVKKARAALKEAETRRNKRPKKSKKEQETNWKLKEGRRRQKSGLKMNDSDISSDDSSDDEPLMSNPKAVQQTRLTYVSSNTSIRIESESSEKSDAYEPSSSSDANYSDNEPRRNDSRTENILNPHDSNSSDDEPLISKMRKQRAAQQVLTTITPSITSSNSPTELESESEDEGPRVPVFSKWKAVQQSRGSEKSMSTSKDEPAEDPLSSEGEENALPP